MNVYNLTNIVSDLHVYTCVYTCGILQDPRRNVNINVYKTIISPPNHNSAHHTPNPKHDSTKNYKQHHAAY